MFLNFTLDFGSLKPLFTQTMHMYFTKGVSLFLKRQTRGITTERERRENRWKRKNVALSSCQERLLPAEDTGEGRASRCHRVTCRAACLPPAVGTLEGSGGTAGPPPQLTAVCSLACEPPAPTGQGPSPF